IRKEADVRMVHAVNGHASQCQSLAVTAVFPEDRVKYFPSSIPLQPLNHSAIALLRGNSQLLLEKGRNSLESASDESHFVIQRIVQIKYNYRHTIRSSAYRTRRISRFDRTNG